MAATLTRDRAPSRAAALEPYLREIQVDSLLTADEERSLAHAIRRGDDNARSRLIRSNLRLVVRIARDYLGRGLTLEDLVGEGNLGLIRATEEFDPDFGTRFSTYAGYWIRQSIRHALLNTTSTIRLPAHMVGLLTKWRRAEQALTRTLGYPPDPERIADELGLSAVQRDLVDRALRARRLCHEGGVEGAWSADEVTDAHDAPESSIEAAEDRAQLLRRMTRLEPRERTILTLRFGLGGQTPMTLKDVGRRLGVTREWVRKIELRAIRKLDDEAPAPPPSAVPVSTATTRIDRPSKPRRVRSAV
jgi:RNA polymerase primary sigma factor